MPSLHAPLSFSKAEHACRDDCITVTLKCTSPKGYLSSPQRALSPTSLQCEAHLPPPLQQVKCPTPAFCALVQCVPSNTQPLTRRAAAVGRVEARPTHTDRARTDAVHHALAAVGARPAHAHHCQRKHKMTARVVHRPPNTESNYAPAKTKAKAS